MIKVTAYWLSAVLIGLYMHIGVAAEVADEKRLSIYNWAEYLPDSVLKDFTRETGIQIKYATYDSNEALHKTMQSHKGKGYDIVVSSSYMVAQFREEKLLQPIDHQKLKNLQNLSISLLNKPYDPGNTYSIPYLWGSTGIAVNSKLINPDEIQSWADLWKPQWRHQLLLLDDMREVFGMALRKNGLSINTQDPREIARAYDDLRQLLPNVKAWDGNSPRQFYLNDTVAIGMLWSGEAMMAQRVNPDIRYIYPKDGAGFWMDSFTIPVGAKHIDNAHVFIDYMLRPEVSKTIMEALGYSTPNGATRELLDENVRENPLLFPAVEVLDSGEFQKNLGDSLAVYTNYWHLLRK